MPQCESDTVIVTRTVAGPGKVESSAPAGAGGPGLCHAAAAGPGAAMGTPGPSEVHWHAGVSRSRLPDPGNRAAEGLRASGRHYSGYFRVKFGVGPAARVGRRVCFGPLTHDLSHGRWPGGQT